MMGVGMYRYMYGWIWPEEVYANWVQMLRMEGEGAYVCHMSERWM